MQQREINKIVEGHRAGTSVEGRFETRQSNQGSSHGQLYQGVYCTKWGPKRRARKMVKEVF